MKRVFNLLVVDESGSMSIIERQALGGHQRDPDHDSENAEDA